MRLPLAFDRHSPASQDKVGELVPIYRDELLSFAQNEKCLGSLGAEKGLSEAQPSYFMRMTLLQHFLNTL